VHRHSREEAEELRGGHGGADELRLRVGTRDLRPSGISLREVVRAVREAGYDVYREEVVLAVEGLRSPEDERRVEEVLGKALGVVECSASHAARSVRVVVNPLSSSVEEVKRLLESLGYRVEGVGGRSRMWRGEPWPSS